jgi:nucleobase:cation symporter-1, NCS1 family
MGYKTAVNQMVLSRSAFGRRGAYLPSALMFLMTLGWIGVNTYFPVKIAVAILGQFGIPDTWPTNLVLITLVMALQVGIGVYGFYAIRTFEKYTVPVTAAIMVLMSVLAWTQPGLVNWGLTTTLAPGAHFAMLTLLMTAIGVGHLLGHLGLGLFPVRAAQRPVVLRVLVQLCRNVRAHGMARLPRCHHRQRDARR